MNHMTYTPGRYVPHPGEPVESRIQAMEQYLVSTGEELERLIHRLNETLEALDTGALS